MAGVGFPESGELVLGTVKDIFRQGAFITLEEYAGRTGMLHLSEISLKWVRNIRDYVKEGQKVVLVVLRVDEHKGHIDLSLRRVSDAQRKQKLQQVKQKQRADKLLELIAKELKEKTDAFKQKVESKLLSDYETVYAGLEAIAANNSLVDKLGVDSKWKKKILELVNKNIKSPFVEITGFVELRSYESDGINIIRKSVQEIEKHKSQDTTIKINYVSAPYYRVTIKAPNYKEAERVLKNAVDQGVNYIESHHGEGAFHRELEHK